jgi:hypothetical protein
LFGALVVVGEEIEPCSWAQPDKLTGQRREEGRFPYVKAPKNQSKSPKKPNFDKF